jgi:hypothetical protein
MSLWASTFALSSPESLIVLLAVTVVALIDLSRRWKNQPTHLLFAVILGTALSVSLIRVGSVVLSPDLQSNAYAIAFGVVLVVLGWYALFGPWEVQTRAMMLGTFLFWVTIHLLLNDDPQARTVELIAAGTALVPAAVWCMLFLKYHTEKIAVVVLLFLSGMLATVPVLFYDALVRHNTSLQFFLFQVKPESFNDIAQSFASSAINVPDGSLSTVLLSSIISFLIVGLIEESSKYWVLIHTGRRIFTSIDDVLQLSIIVAIGFSFAENIINPVYFTAFVQNYLLHSTSPDLMGFFSNVLGRSVLTTMVHIVATGTLGYYLGLALFAGPYLEERNRQGRPVLLAGAIHGLFRIRESSAFRVQMMITGLLFAVLLHGIFNFLVTVPDLLPGNPHSLGDVLGAGAPAFLANIPLLLLPSLFYVVGGFWWLTHLFLKQEDMEEFGHPILTDVYVEKEEAVD